MARKLSVLMVLIVSALFLVGAVTTQAADTAGFTLCYQPPRLNPGSLGRVTLYPNLPNRLRISPSFSAAVVGYIPAGGLFTVVNGPVCSGFSHWWQVNYNGVLGWTAEGDGGLNYWLEPIGYIPPPPPPPPACALPNRLFVGGQGRVTPGLPNTVRTAPGVTGTTRIGLIPGGGVFTVLGGPQCGSDGRWWWQVNYNGLIGWTAEGSGSTYWLEPVTGGPPPPPACALPNRLYVGGQGRVTPGTPNVLRSAPGTNSTGSNSVVIGQIPGGGVFTVLSGPQCGTDGRWWWQVNYNGQIGWTAEGEGAGNYWTEPWGGVQTICQGFLPSRLVAGGTGRVTYDPPLANTVRNGTSFASARLGEIPPGGIFAVLSGPICTENTAWWQVNYNGLIGWTAEGQGSTYWLEPY